MDDYRQPDTPETANEVKMLLDQQAEQAVSSEASKETSADMKAEPVNLEEIVQTKEQLEEVKEQPEELMGEAQEQPEESELTELTKEQPEESEQAELKEKQLDELDAASTEESQEGSMELSMEPSMESSMEVEAKPEDEATREAQSSVFGQAVTLDAIHDSELIKTVNRAKQLLNDLDEAEKDKTRLTGELKQSEKAYSSMEKSVAEGITTALKKKKEEIAATYDRELSQYQDQIDVCKTERAKAKANAIAQRIQVETAPLNQQNHPFAHPLKFKENKVPVVCKKRAISMLFFPKNSRDWTIDILVGVGLIFFIPLFFSLAISNRLVLAFTFFVYVGALFTVYLYLLHKYMLKFAGVNEEVEELRKQIRINNKNKQLMTNRIKKSQDETGYNLGSFDDKITGIQQVMQNTVEKRQEALENFESEIRHQITADITAANKDELLGLQQEFESKRQELSDKKEEIEQIEKQLKEEYEPVFGKDLLYKQRLNKFDSFCQENADLSLEEALTQYRALSGSKLLKK